MTNKFDKSNFVNKFKVEVREHLAQIEKDLLYLEKDPKDIVLLGDVEREMHTIKGSAAMMSYKRISEIAHTFESALAKIKAQQAALDDVHFELLFKALDTIKMLLEDKVTWPGSGIEYPFVADLREKIEKAFCLEGTEKKSQRAGEEERTSQGLREETGQVKTPPPPSAADISSESVRVDVRKLDDLMNVAGELAIRKIRISRHKADLKDLLSYIDELHLKLFQMNSKDMPATLSRDIKRVFEHRAEEFDRIVDELSLTTAELQDDVMRMRMLPLEVIFQAFPRFVRDLSRKEKKLIDFHITGENTELDKAMIEKIQDPLMHMLRNAIIHGIEWPDDRAKAGKSPSGTISLRAYCKGSQVIIEVADDGKGIDPDKIKDHAVKRGLITKEDAARISGTEIFDLLFSPGFSTSETVSEVSGRGVGLDVVKTNVTHMKGAIDINSAVGKGAKFTIALPLSLAVTLALQVKVSRETFLITCDNIVETLKIAEDEICKTDGREAITVRGQIIPLVRLAEVLKLEREKRHAPGRGQAHLPVIIAAWGEKRLAIMVNDLSGKLEVVAKGLGNHLKKVPYISGATIMGAGEIVLILDIPALILDSSALPGVDRPFPVKEENKEKDERSILIVEDSIITRDLEKSILEAAGYNVSIARDGVEALEKLKTGTFDVILADIAMPGMGGVEMMQKLKLDSRLSLIPVVIVSAKETDEDKKRGLAAGASAYLVKSQFDQIKLLDTIERLIG